MSIFIYIILLFLFNSNVTSDLDKVNFLYQHDISEHCRRQVLPSVFLGAHVLEADFKMMHFSKLDLPYSCSIAITTEPGYNIILVTQLQKAQDLESSCSAGDQLVVFPSSRPSPGYWKIERENVNEINLTAGPAFYTMAPTANTNKGIHEGPCKHNHATITEKVEIFTIEVPVVNISAQLLPAKKAISIPSELQLNFDKYVDVTPRDGVSFETHVIPLVNISNIRPGNASKLRTDDGQIRYQIEYNNEFFGISSTTPLPYTSTSRSTLKQKTDNAFKKIVSSTKPLTPNNRQITTPLTKTATKYSEADDGLDDVRRLMKSLNLTNYDVEQATKNKNLRTNKQRRKQTSTRRNNTKVSNLNLGKELSRWTGPSNFRDMNKKLTAKSWNVHDVLDRARISRLKDFTSFAKSTTKTQSTVDVKRNLLKNVELKAKPKITVLFDNEDINDNPKNNHKSSFLESTKEMNNIDPTVDEDIAINVPTKDYYLSRLKEIYKKLSTSNMFEELPSKSRGYFINHESWNNVVQGAPEMIDRLIVEPDNQNVIVNKEQTNGSLNNRGTFDVRHKRYVYPLTIYDRPQTRPKKCSCEYRPEYEHYDSNFYNLFHINELLEPSADESEFKELLGMSNDEIVFDAQSEGYAPMFNICDRSLTKRRLVTLLNASRVMIFISNYTMHGMTLILTSAKILNKQTEKCSVKQLECQISGYRVCIDSNCACDGVPNCGSYNIYDEDRLRCAPTEDENKILPVIALVAIIFTFLYSIYFWLQRCVPNISEAFFVYIAGTENMLYLDSVMRSPKDDDTPRQLHPNYFEEVTKLNNYQDPLKQTFCARFWRSITCRKPKERHQSVSPSEENRRSVYSFTQFELENMVGRSFVDVNIQTGESLEYINTLMCKEQPRHRRTENNEQTLRTIQLMKTSSESLFSYQLRKTNNEKDMKTEHLRNVGTEPDIEQEFVDDDHIFKVRDSNELIVKKLRFECADDNGNDDYNDEDDDVNVADPDDNQPSTSKDQRWFWNRDKKRPQKKQIKK